MQHSAPGSSAVITIRPACAAKIASVGKRALRRPLTSDEVAANQQGSGANDRRG